MRRRVIIACIIITTGCLSLPPKDRASRGIEAIHTGLVAAQTAESDLFDAGLLPGFDDPAFHTKLADAFRLNGNLATFLIMWQPGESIPIQLAELSVVVRDLVAIVTVYTNDEIDIVLIGLSQALSEIGKISQILRTAGETNNG